MLVSYFYGVHIYMRMLFPGDVPSAFNLRKAEQQRRQQPLCMTTATAPFETPTQRWITRSFLPFLFL